MKGLISIVAFAVVLNPFLFVFAQENTKPVIFDEIKILVKKGDDISQKSVEVEFMQDSLTIAAKDGTLKKTFVYEDIKRAEYSYTKNPRWKTGLGLSAAALAFPLLWIATIPIGFTKHRRHWLTIQTEEDYAVLKLSKSNRKLFMPTFETKTGVTIDPVGEDK